VEGDLTPTFTVTLQAQAIHGAAWSYSKKALFQVAQMWAFLEDGVFVGSTSGKINHPPTGASFLGGSAVVYISTHVHL
jgi:hypothetical protein